MISDERNYITYKFHCFASVNLGLYNLSVVGHISGKPIADTVDKPVSVRGLKRLQNTRDIFPDREVKEYSPCHGVENSFVVRGGGVEGDDSRVSELFLRDGQSAYGVESWEDVGKVVRPAGVPAVEEFVLGPDIPGDLFVDNAFTVRGPGWGADYSSGGVVIGFATVDAFFCSAFEEVAD